MTGIKNTSRTPNPEWLMGGNPRAIEQQETEGQRQLVASELLPTHGSEDPRIQAFGIEFGPVVQGDNAKINLAHQALRQLVDPT